MDRKEIEQNFSSAGWDVDGSFGELLVIGYSGDSTSLLAHKEVWEADNGDPSYVILDHERLRTYWVREVPTPLQAIKLVKEHGKLSEE